LLKQVARIFLLLAPIPVGYIEEIQLREPEIDYSTSGETTLEDIQLE
jgi:hypothetical protein